ncbi:MAG: flagellar assembly peptidoglycan hydrolase FlgJ [Rhizobiales bacterium]|nr:flagellar assembly peptidoglycan hydrolase FlgJ [Hyphomicrobiales bacterium]
MTAAPASLPVSSSSYASAVIDSALQRAKAGFALADKARSAAQDFEAVFLNSMFQQMFTSIEGEGPFGGGPAVGVWRSLLTDEYAKSFTKQGGIGIADQVYRSLIAAQEARAR